jgi:alanine racemase
MDPRLAGGYLTIDLAAIQRNYRRMQQVAGTRECAAVVKANAYGLGIEHVAPALAAQGCQKFFVALPEEGIELRRLLPAVDIFILCGLFEGCEEIYIHERLAPVLNTLDEIQTWSALTTEHGPLPAIIHVDTGITRLGLREEDIKQLAQHPEMMDGLEIDFVMSHLACADEPDTDFSDRQLSQLHKLKALLPEGLQNTPFSLCNSSGLFLGDAFHHDLIRPGIALYGGNPLPQQENPVEEVVNWQGKILQVHDVDSEIPVGYGATYHTTRKQRIATVAVGYADGYFRNLSNKAKCAINGKRVPVVGRVSMDMLTIDVTDIPVEESKRGCLVSLIGGGISLGELAQWADTIPYEVLTSLGNRCHKRYLDAEQ